jgi:pilus assembly protein CpaF
MAIPTSRPTGPAEEPELPIIPPTSFPDDVTQPVTPVAPVEDSTTHKLPVRPLLDAAPNELPEKSIYLDDRPVEPVAPRPSVQVQAKFGIGTQSEHLTVADLIKNDYSIYAGLEDKIVSVTAWLRDILNEQNLTEDIAAARGEQPRGEKFQNMKVIIDQLLTRYFATETNIRRQDIPVVTAMVTNEMLGLGPIEPLWQDPTISEIMVNGPYSIVVEIKGRLVNVPGARFRDQAHLLEVSQQILAPLGRTIDIANPYEDGRLQDGSRINITHPVISGGKLGPYLTIRRFPDTIFSLKKLVDLNSLTPEMAVEIGNLIYAGCAIIIVGGAGAGKTSFLNALSDCVPSGERIITVEDNLELQLNPKRHVISLEARKSHQGEKGNVTIRDLVRNTLRMRPDRIIVGEVRDGSAYDMLQAMNTGHDGSMTTIHANDAKGGIDRLVNLMSEVGDIDTQRALSLIAGGIDVMVVIDRFLDDGSRRVAAVVEIPSRVNLDDGIATLDPITLFEFNQTGVIQDENGEDKIVGEYKKVNDISDALVRKHRLNNRKQLTLEEIYALSDS